MRPMIKIDLPSIEDLIAPVVGELGTPDREKFNAEAMALNYAAVIKERRQTLHLTQEQLGQRVGKQRSYIARLENGKVDIQLSSLLTISSALGLKFALTAQ